MVPLSLISNLLRNRPGAALLLLVGGLSVVARPTGVLALASSSYQIPQYSLSQGSNRLNSQSFGLTAEVAPIHGVSSSGSYGLDAGFPAETGGSITLGLSGTALTFGTLTPNSSSTATLTATVTTTDSHGYSLAINSPTGLLKSGGSTTVSDIASSIAAPATWTGNGFGFTVPTATALEAKWASGSAYAAVPSSLTTFHQVLQAINAADHTTVQFQANPSSTQNPGTYTATVGLLATVSP